MALGDLLFPTIFNVVVDAVVWHWVQDMVESAGGQGRCGREGRHQNTVLYADDGMIALSDQGWMQGAFISLVGMFYWVGISTNVVKTVGMIYRMCQAAGTQSEAAYKQRLMGAVFSYQERQGVQLQCSEYGE